MVTRCCIPASALLALALPHLAACGGAGASCPQLEGAPEPPDIRDDVSLLLTDLAAENVCGSIEGTFVQLTGATPGGESRSEGDTPPASRLPGTGRLWVKECSSEDVRGRLRVELSGLAWQWIARETQTLGATFALAEYVRFRADVRLVGEVEPSYARHTKLLQLSLQPTDPVMASVQPIQSVDVEPEGIWANLVAAVVEALTGEGIDERARERIATRGSRVLRLQLRQGMGIAVDLCTGHRFASVGAMRTETLPERPEHLDDGRWITTERTRLQPGGLDVAGPWSTHPGDLHGRVEASGGDVVAQLLCADQAQRLVEAYLRGEPLPGVEVLAEEVVAGDTEARLQASTEGCDVALVVRPESEQGGPVLVTADLWAPDARVPPTRQLLRCPSPARR